MNRKRFANKRKVINIMSEMKKLNSEKQLIIANLIHDFEAHQTDRRCDLEDKKSRAVNAVRQEFKLLLMQIPSNVANRTIDEILKSGGSLNFSDDNNDNNNGLQIVIPKSLFGSNHDLTQSLINKSRQPLNSVSMVSNKFNANTTHKDMTLKLPSMGPKTKKSPNTTDTRLTRSVAKLQTRSNTKTNTKPLTKSKCTPTEEVIPEMSSSIEESKSETKLSGDSELLKVKSNMKTTSHTFLSKPPRKPNPNEEIIICSTSGTPLLIDEKSVKRIMESNK